MKRVLSIGLFFMLAGVVSIAMAEQEVKIGYVDFQRAVSSSDAGKDARLIFQSEVEMRQKDLDRMKENLEKSKGELESQGYLLSEETRVKKEKEYQDKLKEVQRYYKDSQDELQAKDIQLTKKLISEFRSIIESIGRERNYTAIFEKSDSNLLYADKAIDLTAEVIKRNNESRAKK